MITTFVDFWFSFWQHFSELDNLAYFFVGVFLSGVIMGFANFLYSKSVMKSMSEVILKIQDDIKKCSTKK